MNRLSLGSKQKKKNPKQNKLTNRKKAEKNLMDFMSVLCVLVVQHPALVIGGMVRNI